MEFNKSKDQRLSDKAAKHCYLKVWFINVSRYFKNPRDKIVFCLTFCVMSSNWWLNNNNHLMQYLKIINHRIFSRYEDRDWFFLATWEPKVREIENMSYNIWKSVNHGGKMIHGPVKDLKWYSNAISNYLNKRTPWHVHGFMT